MAVLAEMRVLLGLILPVLFPSWRFFKDIGASPRIEVCIDRHWREAVQRPEHIPPRSMLGRLFCNATGNERLFLTALAERTLTEPEGPAPAILAARLGRRHGQVPFRIWLETGQGRDLAFEGTA